MVKLVHPEPESGALRGWLGERAETGWISSVLTEIEPLRVLARYAPGAVAWLPAVLDQIELIGLDPPIRILAQTASFVTYDKRLLDAALAAGRAADSPS